jgi:signal transduction histidine kinase
MASTETGIYFTLIMGLSVLTVLITLFGISLYRWQRTSIREYKNRVFREIALVESERKRIAADLHDDLGSNLAAVRMGLETLCEQATDKIAATKTIGQLDKSLVRLKEISHNLLPAILQAKGLCAAMKELVDEITISGKINIRYVQQCPDSTFLPEKSILVFRIFQEILSNSLKHAQASRIQAEITLVNNQVVLNVSDNGIGFTETKNLGFQKSFGLGNIRSRADLLEASLTLQSGAGKGTSYHIKIPLTSLQSPK